MHCLDCGTQLTTVNYTESCTKWHCSKCNAHWFQTRIVKVDWSKQTIPLNSDNGGINAPTTSTPTCCECSGQVDTSGLYGTNEPYFYCKDCMNADY